MAAAELKNILNQATRPCRNVIAPDWRTIW